MTEVTGRIIRDKGLSSSEKLVYLYVASAYRIYYRNPVDYVSFEQLADEINFSVSTVRKALKTLEDLELVRVDSSYKNRLSIEVLYLDNGFSVLRQLASAGGR